MIEELKQKIAELKQKTAGLMPRLTLARLTANFAREQVAKGGGDDTAVSLADQEVREIERQFEEAKETLRAAELASQIPEMTAVFEALKEDVAKLLPVVNRMQATIEQFRADEAKLTDLVELLRRAHVRLAQYQVERASGNSRPMIAP